MAGRARSIAGQSLKVLGLLGAAISLLRQSSMLNILLGGYVAISFFSWRLTVGSVTVYGIVF